MTDGRGEWTPHAVPLVRPGATELDLPKLKLVYRFLEQI